MMFSDLQESFSSWYLTKESLSSLPRSCNLLILLNPMCYKYVFEEVQTLKICTKSGISLLLSPCLLSHFPFLFQ